MSFGLGQLSRQRINLYDTLEYMEEKVIQVEKEYKELLEKYELEPRFYIDFPIYKQLPPEVQLALLVLQKHSYTIKAAYTERRKLQNAENQK